MTKWVVQLVQQLSRPVFLVRAEDELSFPEACNYVIIQSLRTLILESPLESRTCSEIRLKPHKHEACLSPGRRLAANVQTLSAFRLTRLADFGELAFEWYIYCVVCQAWTCSKWLRTSLAIRSVFRIPTWTLPSWRRSTGASRDISSWTTTTSALSRNFTVAI